MALSVVRRACPSSGLPWEYVQFYSL